MNRGVFLKSLLTLIIAPKVIGEINFDKLAAKNIATGVGATRTLVSDLQLLTPRYYEKFVKIYGNENFTFSQEILGQQIENQ